MSWDRFKKYYLPIEKLNFSLDISYMDFSSSFFRKMETKINSAFDSMEDLENGAIANPDENRMVGHYWLRMSQLAPNKKIEKEIDLIIFFLSKIRKYFR